MYWPPPKLEIHLPVLFLNLCLMSWTEFFFLGASESKDTTFFILVFVHPEDDWQGKGIQAPK